MISRLEVTSGSGVAIRYGSVAAWTTPDASAALHAFLIESARNLADSPEAGQILVDHLVAVLGAGDPEPQVGFAVVGPGRSGLVGLLHGPVQAWDGDSWTVVPSQPGWARLACTPSPALFVNRSGDATPAAAPSSVLDLEAGIVPGGGFILWPFDTAGDPLQEGDLAVGASHEALDVTLVDGTPEVQGATQVMASVPLEDFADLPKPGEPGAATPDLHAWVFNLRSAVPAARRRSGSPLPAVGSPFLVDGSQVLVGGVRCHRGHLNRPGMIFCAVCSSPVRDGEEPPTVGPRPPLGCLVTSDGGVYRLDSDYKVGLSTPGNPDGVCATNPGLSDPHHPLRPLDFGGDPTTQGRAEILLEGWDVVVVDGGSDVGTYLYPPGASKWQRMASGARAVLAPGSHISFGRNVVTYINPWVAAPPADAADPERPSQ